MSSEENLVVYLPVTGKEGKRTVGVRVSRLISPPNWTHRGYDNSH